MAISSVHNASIEALLNGISILRDGLPFLEVPVFIGAVVADREEPPNESQSPQFQLLAFLEGLLIFCPHFVLLSKILDDGQGFRFGLATQCRIDLDFDFFF